MSSRKGDKSGLECLGVIFQFNKDSILFEFQYEDDEAIGIVPTSNLILRNGKKLPQMAFKGDEELNLFFDVGDEVTCTVMNNKDLREFTFLEDGEKIRIRPDWFANTATLVGRPRKDGKDEIGLVDYDITLAPDDEDISFMFGESKERIDERRRELSKPFPKPVSVKTYEKDSKKETKEINWREQEPKKHTSARSGSSVYRAELIILKKPHKGKDAVIGGIMEIKEGGTSSRYVGKRGVFCNSSVSIFGHQLAKADLSYYLRKGDEFNIEINDIDGSLSIKRAWFSGHDNNISYNEEMKTPERHPNNDRKFRDWLDDRGISFRDFKEWVGGRTKAKPFFPFESPIYSGTIVCVVNGSDSVGEGGLFRITSEGHLKGKLAVFEKSDFYIGGVNIGDTDLRMILRPKDVIKAQIMEMSTADKKRYKYLTKDKEVPLCGQLCFIGKTIPNSNDMKPSESNELAALLEEKIGITLENFIEMRAASSADAKSAGNGNEDDLLQFAPLNLSSYTIKNPGSLMSLVTRTLSISSTNDPILQNLLETPEEISNAIWLSKVFTHALLLKMQSKMKDKIYKKHRSNFVASIKEQESRIASIERNSVMKSSQNTHDNIESIRSNVNAKKCELMEKMKIVERKIEEETKNTSNSYKTSRSKAPNRNVKKMLESYKSSSSSSVRKDSDKSALSSMTPLELLRYYLSRNKTIAVRNDKLWFGDISYPLNTETNFLSKGSRQSKTFYTLHDLYFLYKNKKLDPFAYSRMAAKEVCAVVHREDRDIVLDYLTGKIKNAPNIMNISRKREVTPEESQLKKEPSSEKKSRFASIEESSNGGSFKSTFIQSNSEKADNDKRTNIPLSNSQSRITQNVKPQIIPPSLLQKTQGQQHSWLNVASNSAQPSSSGIWIPPPPPPTLSQGVGSRVIISPQQQFQRQHQPLLSQIISQSPLISQTPLISQPPPLTQPPILSQPPPHSQPSLSLPLHQLNVSHSQFTPLTSNITTASVPNRISANLWSGKVPLMKDTSSSLQYKEQKLDKPNVQPLTVPSTTPKVVGFASSFSSGADQGSSNGFYTSPSLDSNKTMQLMDQGSRYRNFPLERNK